MPRESRGILEVPSGRRQRKRVLVVDDDERILISAEIALETAGYDTSTAWSGREAITRLQSEAYDLILIDDYPGDIPSREILNQIRRLGLNVPVVLMQTSAPNSQAAAEYSRLGVRQFVNKCTPDDLIAVADEFLSAARALARTA